MKIWVVGIGEPLPLDGNIDRLHRCGLLNEILTNMGEEVVWWTSTFNHFSKKHLYNKNTTINLKNNYKIELLHGIGYKKNISINRIWNHIQIANQFKKLSKNYEKPDIIFCAFPSIELASSTVRYAISNKIPIVIDVRDLWPDIFLNVTPNILKYITKLFLFKYFKMTKFIFSNSTSITGITNGIVDWGISYANRKKNKSDKTFYLGYNNEFNDLGLTKQAKKIWNDIGISENNFIISYVGALAKNKINLDPIFNSAEYFKENSNIKFVIAGEGDDKQYFINQSNGLNNIIFPGWINKYQIKSLLEISKLGLVPINNRIDYMLSIPNKPIEYIAFKLPLLSSLEGELKSLIETEDIGFYYNSVNGLIKIIEKLHNDSKLLEEKRNNCKKVFEKYFNSKIVYNNLAQYLQNRVSNN